MMAFIQDAGDESEKFQTVLNRRDADILALLQGEHRVAYESGIQDAFSELPEAANDASKQNITSYHDDKEQQLSELSDRRDTVRDKKDKLELLAKKSKDDFKTELENMDRELTNLRSLFDAASTQSQMTAANVVSMNNQLSRLQMELDEAKNDKKDRNDSRALESRITELINMRNACEVIYKNTLLKINQIRLRAIWLFQTRNQLISQYQQVYNEMLDQSNKLDKWEKLVVGQERALKKSLAVKKPQPAASSQTKSLAKCFPLDFEKEKQDILASFPREIQLDKSGN